jgi:ribosomal protein S18 acetylase RimI-like enzyme
LFKENSEKLKRKQMTYQLIQASIEDEAWLERLRRDVYQELDIATFGTWDEARHGRQFGECWNHGGISIIEVEGARVGMIQLFDQPDAVEVGEIQIQPSHQNQGIGSRVLKDTIARFHEQRKKVLLSVALKNERAYRLYQRLGFQKIAHNDTHNLMACDPQG